MCEDNGLGISVPTPEGWVEEALRSRLQLRYEVAEGSDPAEVLGVASDLAAWVGSVRRPAVLHLRTVRYLSHAGADAEIAYRTPQAIRADYDRDPILGTARWLVASGKASGEELATDYLAAREQAQEVALEAAARPQMSSAEQVMAPLGPRSAGVVAERASRVKLETDDELTLAQAINTGLAAVLERHPGALLLVQDMAAKGGVYGYPRPARALRRGPRVRHPPRRDVDSRARARRCRWRLPPDSGDPVPRVPPQRRGPAARRGSDAAVLLTAGVPQRDGGPVAGYGYQRGFGGHFHNDDAVGVLRDIPGIVVASPSRPDDAAAMLATCAASASVDGNVYVFLEPIALYHTRDLHEDGDEEWCSELTADHAPVGSARTYLDGNDLTIVTWGNGFFMALRVAQRLATRGIRPASSICAGSRRSRSRTSSVRPARRWRPRRGRDEANRRGLRGRGRGPRRRGFRRAARAGCEQGLVRPARRRRQARASLGG